MQDFYGRDDGRVSASRPTTDASSLFGRGELLNPEYRITVTGDRRTPMFSDGDLARLAEWPDTDEDSEYDEEPVSGNNRQLEVAFVPADGWTPTLPHGQRLRGTSALQILPAFVDYQYTSAHKTSMFHLMDENIGQSNRVAGARPFYDHCNLDSDDRGWELYGADRARIDADIVRLTLRTWAAGSRVPFDRWPAYVEKRRNWLSEACGPPPLLVERSRPMFLSAVQVSAVMQHDCTLQLAIGMEGQMYRCLLSTEKFKVRLELVFMWGGAMHLLLGGDAMGDFAAAFSVLLDMDWCLDEESHVRTVLDEIRIRTALQCQALDAWGSMFEVMSRMRLAVADWLYERHVNC